MKFLVAGLALLSSLQYTSGALQQISNAVLELPKLTLVRLLLWTLSTAHGPKTPEEVNDYHALQAT